MDTPHPPPNRYRRNRVSPVPYSSAKDSMRTDTAAGCGNPKRRAWSLRNAIKRPPPFRWTTSNHSGEAAWAFLVGTRPTHGGPVVREPNPALLPAKKGQKALRTIAISKRWHIRLPRGCFNVLRIRFPVMGPAGLCVTIRVKGDELAVRLGNNHLP